MAKRRSWSDEELAQIVPTVYSYRAVIRALGLIPAGGNYVQVQHKIKELSLDVSHFRGSGWNVGGQFQPRPKVPLAKLLVSRGTAQSYKLKQKLFKEGLKYPACELCGWAAKSADGRIPVELDHINGDHYDNRLENLRILCPNCHSLQPTHRGKNKKVHLARVAK